MAAYIANLAVDYDRDGMLWYFQNEEQLNSGFKKASNVSYALIDNWLVVDFIMEK